MYTFSSRLKTIAFVLMILGVLGIGYSFFTAPKTVEDVEKILAADSHHNGGHAEAAHHDEAAAPEAHAAVNGESHAVEAVNEGHNTIDAETAVVNHNEVSHAVHGAEAHDAHAEHEHHLKHVLSQLQNKPWAGVYVAALFFMLISLGALAFYAIQNAAQAGWSPVLFRVMEGVSSYLIPGAIIVFLLLVAGVLQWHHLFIWMDPDVVAEDQLIQRKTG
jgi:hypothetical protein